MSVLIKWKFIVVLKFIIRDRGLDLLRSKGGYFELLMILFFW